MPVLPAHTIWSRAKNVAISELLDCKYNILTSIKDMNDISLANQTCLFPSSGKTELLTFESNTSGNGVDLEGGVSNASSSFTDCRNYASAIWSKMWRECILLWTKDSRTARWMPVAVDAQYSEM